MGVLTQYLLQREDIDLKLVELDGESVDYLLTHFPGMQGRLYQADYLRLDIHKLFPGPYRVIGNLPYNMSSQLFFKILDDKDRIPEVVCMIQKEVAERIAEGPGSKTYGILSVLLQAWYDIDYVMTVGSGAFAPPPKVQSAVIRLRRNGRTPILWVPGHSAPAGARVVDMVWGQRGEPSNAGHEFFDTTKSYYLNHLDTFEILSAATYQQPCRWQDQKDKCLGPVLSYWHDVAALRTPTGAGATGIILRTGDVSPLWTIRSLPGRLTSNAASWPRNARCSAPRRIRSSTCRRRSCAGGLPTSTARFSPRTRRRPPSCRNTRCSPRPTTTSPRQ